MKLDVPEYLREYKINIKGLIEEDSVNYRKLSMFIAFPRCSFKCEHECGKPICQNSKLAKEAGKEFEIYSLIERYLDNPITSAIVFGGLEPLDSSKELYFFCIHFREHCDDDIVIYTGYKEDEQPVQDLLNVLKVYKVNNVYIKFGRFIPDCEPHYDEVLGVNLASPNQYGKKIEFQYDEENKFKRN